MNSNRSEDGCSPCNSNAEKKFKTLTGSTISEEPEVTITNHIPNIKKGINQFIIDDYHPDHSNTTNKIIPSMSTKKEIEVDDDELSMTPPDEPILFNTHEESISIDDEHQITRQITEDGFVVTPTSSMVASSLTSSRCQSPDFGSARKLFALKNKSLSLFNIPNEKKMTDAPGAHQTLHYIEKVNAKNKEKKYVVKYYIDYGITYPPDDKTENHLKLEAAISHFYRVHARHLAPNVNAAYDNQKKLVAVTSSMFIPWEPVKKFPITKNDLYIEVLAKGLLSIPELDIYDEQIRCGELTFTDGKISIEKKITFCGKAVSQKFNLTEEDVKRFRKIKGAGIMIALCDFFAEGDFHGNNVSVWGQHIDDDMGCWFFTKDYKKIDAKLMLSGRMPDDDTFKIIPENIVNLPIREKGKPGDLFFMPGKDIQIAGIPDALVNWVVSNSFPPESNEAYRAMAPLRVFNYFKYQTYLSCILPESEYFRKIQLLHLSKDDPCVDELHKGQNIVDVLTSQLAQRKKEYTDVLTDLPQFKDFLNENGSFVIERLKKNFENENIRYKKTLSKDHTSGKKCSLDQSTCLELETIPDELFNLDKINKQYEQIKFNTTKKNPKIKNFDFNNYNDDQKNTDNDVLKEFDFDDYNNDQKKHYKTI